MDTLRFDPFGQDLLVDPYGLYSRLRRQAVVRAGPGIFALPRYADISRMLRDERAGHGQPRGFDATTRGAGVARLVAAHRPNDELPGAVSALDPPDHPRVRRVLTKALHQVVAAELNEVAASAARESVAALPRGTVVDAVADLAWPLQLRLTGALLGVSAGQLTQVAPAAQALGRAIILVPYVSPEHGNGEAEARELKGWISQRLRTGASRGGLLGQLSHDDAADGLSRDEVVDNLAFVIFAGFETTIFLVCSVLELLARHPEQLDRLRRSPGLAGSAVEEAVRFDAPLQWVSRVLHDDIEVAGHTIHAGRFVLLLLGSGNRDPEAFADPDVFSIERRPNRHLSFGGGAHHCLGVQVARLAARCVVSEIVRAGIWWEPAGPAQRIAHPLVRGFDALPLRIGGSR